MSKVFVLDIYKRPLDPIHPAQARLLLRNKKAAVFKRFPFTIILKKLIGKFPEPLRIKFDPGAKTTGIAIVNDLTGEIVFAAELQHRGFAIRESLTSRRQLRRGRRARKTRYRKPRFVNRKRSDGWLAPSLMSRVENIETWFYKLRALAPIKFVSVELVRFDTQLMQNPEIQGKEYQQGTLAGYETREYLLEKFGRKCAYCDKQNVPLQIEHIHPRSKGGSNRISNLTLSCEKCNVKKGTTDIRDFLKKDPSKLEKILRESKKPLADTAAVNATRWKVYEIFKNSLLPVETGSGGLTKFNRSQQGLEKTHWIDAACVGKSTPEKLTVRLRSPLALSEAEGLIIQGVKPLLITANGHGNRQMCGTDKFGFPSRHRTKKQIHFGFQTGDIIKAVVTSGKKVGKYVGRVLCRATGSFDIATKAGRIAGISYKYCSAIHKKDGYSYGA